VGRGVINSCRAVGWAEGCDHPSTPNLCVFFRKLNHQFRERPDAVLELFRRNGPHACNMVVSRLLSRASLSTGREQMR